MNVYDFGGSLRFRDEVREWVITEEAHCDRLGRMDYSNEGAE